MKRFDLSHQRRAGLFLISLLLNCIVLANDASTTQIKSGTKTANGEQNQQISQKTLVSEFDYFSDTVDKPTYSTHGSLWTGSPYATPEEGAAAIGGSIQATPWCYRAEGPTGQICEHCGTSVPPFHPPEFTEANPVQYPGGSPVSAPTSRKGFMRRIGMCTSWFPPESMDPYCRSTGCQDGGEYTYYMHGACPSPWMFKSAGGKNFCGCRDGEEIGWDLTKGWVCQPDCHDSVASALNPACARQDLTCKPSNPTEPLTTIKSQSEIDYQGAGFHPLQFIRSFRSSMRSPVHAGDWKNWTHNWQMHIEAHQLTGGSGLYNGKAFSVRSDGSWIAFKVPSQPGSQVITPTPVPGQTTYTVSQFFFWDSLKAGDKSTLSETVQLEFEYRKNQMELVNRRRIGWTLQDATLDQTESYDEFGQLKSIKNSLGWTYTLSYNAQKQVSKVTNQFGRSLGFRYDFNGRLVNLLPPGANENAQAGQADSPITYRYDEPESFANGVFDAGNPLRRGQLTSVVWQDGKSRRYRYEDNLAAQLVTGVIDENNVRLSTYTYDQGKTRSVAKIGRDPVYFTNNVGFTDVTSGLYPNYKTSRYNYSTEFKGLVVPTTITGNCPECQPGFKEIKYDTTTSYRRKIINDNGTVTFFEYDARGRTTEEATYPATFASQETKPALNLATHVKSSAWYGNYNVPTAVAEPGVLRLYTYSIPSRDVRTADTTPLPKIFKVTQTLDATGKSKFSPALTDRVSEESFSYFGNLLPRTYSYKENGVLTENYQFTYNAQSELQTATNLMNNKTARVNEYDVHGRMLEAVTDEGIAIRQRYDLRGRAILFGTPTQTALTTYTDDGQIQSFVDGQGVQTVFFYENSQLIRVEQDGVVIANGVETATAPAIAQEKAISNAKSTMPNLTQVVFRIPLNPPYGPTYGQQLAEYGQVIAGRDGVPANVILATSKENKKLELETLESLIRAKVLECTTGCKFYSEPTFTLRTAMHITFSGHLEGTSFMAANKSYFYKEIPMIPGPAQEIASRASQNNPPEQFGDTNAYYTLWDINIGKAAGLQPGTVADTSCMKMLVNNKCRGTGGGVTGLSSAMLTNGVNEIVSLYPVPMSFCAGKPVTSFPFVIPPHIPKASK